LRHLLLYGSYDLTIDEKSRMGIPSEVRKELVTDRDGEAFFCVPGIDGRPWLYPELAYEALISRDRSELTPGDDILDYDRMNLGLATKIKMDPQGRVNLSDKLLKAAGLGREVTLVGNRDHLEIWKRSDWEQESEALMRRRAEIARKAREKRDQPPPPPATTAPPT
jgi:MraZ protein